MPNRRLDKTIIKSNKQTLMAFFAQTFTYKYNKHSDAYIIAALIMTFCTAPDCGHIAKLSPYAVLSYTSKIELLN